MEPRDIHLGLLIETPLDWRCPQVAIKPVLMSLAINIHEMLNFNDLNFNHYKDGSCQAIIEVGNASVSVVKSKLSGWKWDVLAMWNDGGQDHWSCLSDEVWVTIVMHDIQMGKWW